MSENRNKKSLVGALAFLFAPVFVFFAGIFFGAWMLTVFGSLSWLAQACWAGLKLY